MKKVYYAIIIIAIILPIPFILGLISGLFRPELPITQRDFKVGIAGYVPRNFPDSTQEDGITFFNEISQLGELFGVYVAWDDNPDGNGIPEIVNVAFAVKNQYSPTPVVALSFNHKKVTDNYFTENRISYKNALLATVQAYKVEYLAIGVEVNSIYTTVSPIAFNDFVDFYKEAYDAVKATSPNTTVFTIFQLEHLKGAARLTGLNIPESWNLIDQFGEKLDLVGFTAYPFLEYRNIKDVPDEYYLEIADFVDKPIAFTEMGWPSINIDSSGIRVINSNQSSQVDFILGILNATNSLDVELFIHPFLHDAVFFEDIPLFNNIALKKNDGTPKEIYSYWQALVSTPFAS